MKTLTAQIDVINVTAKKDGTYLVEYWDESHNGENNVTMQISEDALLDYIIANDMNREYFTNWSICNLECDGLDEMIINPIVYLNENLDEVIKDYITANS